MRISPFWQGVLVVVAAYLIFDNAFPPVMPKTLLIQYMIIVVIGVLLYFSFDDERWAAFQKPVLSLLRDDERWLARGFFMLAIPAIVGYTSYSLVKPSIDAPVELRQVHPAPPSKLKVFNKTFDLTKLENPKRTKVLEMIKSEPEAAMELYDETVMAGREIYYKNCFYCHGDLLDGTGPFAHGFNPQPINFQDVGTIAQLQEAFLFWRISTGGPGLPKEGTPWNSAMPVWHEMLGEDDVWNVITFLYDYIGQVPRIWDPEVSKTVTGMKDRINAERAAYMGKDLYKFRCEVCHGEQGMGDGPAAEFLYPRPRDFSLALFKYKTSPPQALPLDSDLFNTIKHGLPGTGMPGWKTLMSDAQIESLIPVIKRFDITAAWAPEDAEDEDFDDDGYYIKDDFIKETDLEPDNGQIAYTPESLEKGKKAFLKACKECHGAEGRGNITSGKKLADDWENRIWPRDLTKPWTWRATEIEAGDKSQDATIKRIYQRLSIGIPGTPMPAHRAVEEGNQDPVSLEDRWHIANYVYSLRDTTIAPGDGGVINAVKVSGSLPESVDDPRWGEVAATSLHLVPNIIKDERLFTPLNDSITVRAIYNDRDISFMLEIDDRTDSRPGEKVSEGIQDENLTLHSDAVAIQFPQEKSYESSPVVEKPLYRHGDKKHPTTIWYWNAGSVEPVASQQTMILDATGPNEKLQPRIDDRTLSASGQWQDGRLRVIMKRPRLGGKSGDINFIEGQFLPISFANWDGSNGEAGSRHTLTTWYWLLLPPEVDLQRTYGLPAGIAIFFFVLGLLLVRSQRQKRD